jgi:hypothetical protein
MKTIVAFVTLLCFVTTTAYADEAFKLREPELNARRMKKVGIGMSVAGSLLLTASMAPLSAGWLGESAASTQAAFNVGVSFLGVGLALTAVGSILWITGGARAHRAMGRGVGLSSNGSVVVRF